MSNVLKNRIATMYALTRRVLRKITFILRSTYQTLASLGSTQDFSASLDGKFYSTTFPAQPTVPTALSLKTEDRTNAFFYRLTGHAKGHYSLAIVNRSLAVALNRRSEQQACFVPLDDGIKKTLQQMPEILDRDLCAVIANTLPASPNKPVVSIVHHYPVITDDASADIRLIIFFWEETAIPHATISLLNEKFDAILVAAEFVASALRNSGCNKPIFVIPMGVDHLVDYSAPLMHLQDITPEKPFRFLHVSSVFERKGPEFLLAAFIEQFDANDNVELYIKTFPNPHNRIHEQLALFSATKNNPPRVIIDETDASKETLQSLYRSAHTLVLPTRGEGFNLPAAEALALGLPVIVTGFGAHIDFCTTKTSLLIPFCFDLSESHLKGAHSCWVTPDTLALSSLLQQSVDEVLSHSEHLQQRREAGYALMRATYTWDRAAQGITNALGWLTANPALKPLNENDFSLQVIPCASLDDLLECSLHNTGVDALLFKFEGHLVNQITSHMQGAILDKLRMLQPRTILLLELTGAIEANARYTHLGTIQVFLKSFDRVIVQSLEDYNHILGTGNIRNVVFLPRLSEHASGQKIRHQRIKNMILGLKHDRQRLND